MTKLRMSHFWQFIRRAKLTGKDSKLGKVEDGRRMKWIDSIKEAMSWTYKM